MGKPIVSAVRIEIDFFEHEAQPVDVTATFLRDGTLQEGQVSAPHKHDNIPWPGLDVLMAATEAAQKIGQT